MRYDVTTREVRNGLGSLLDRVNLDGARVVIIQKRDGRPVGELVPYRDAVTVGMGAVALHTVDGEGMMNMEEPPAGLGRAVPPAEPTAGWAQPEPPAVLEDWGQAEVSRASGRYRSPAARLAEMMEENDDD